MIYTQPHERQQRIVGIPMSRKPRLTPEEVAKAVVQNLGKGREFDPMPVLPSNPTPVDRIIYDVALIKRSYGHVPERSMAIDKTLAFMHARLEHN